MNGSFSEEALEAYNRLAAAKLPADFAEGEIYDFARCVRPDGSAYGTGGTCRKGTESGSASEAEKPKRDLSKLDKEWEDARIKTYKSLKGKSKEELLSVLNQHRKIHGMSMKSSIRDLKGGIMAAIHGNESPSERAERNRARFGNKFGRTS